MMYPYLAFPDGTVVTHSHVIEADGKSTVQVHFERAIPSGFQSARCQLPDYTWKFNDGYSSEDIAFFEEFLRHNAHLLFRFAAQGGMHCA